MLHTPIDPSITDSKQTGRYDIIALNLILEDVYNNAKNTEDYQKYSRLTDTLLNQIGRYIDSDSSNFGTTTPACYSQRFGGKHTTLDCLSLLLQRLFGFMFFA